MVGMMSKSYSFEEFCRPLFNNGYAIEHSFELHVALIHGCDLRMDSSLSALGTVSWHC